MVQSLSKLAIAQLCENFDRGDYVGKNIQVCFEVSNQVIDHFQSTCNNTNRLIEMSRQLNTTVAKLGTINEHKVEFASKQNCLDTLEVLGVDRLPRKYKDTHDKVFIMKTLRKMINVHSRKTLTNLSLNGLDPSERNWTYMLGKTLPNLDHLSVRNCSLDNHRFRQICQEFSKLTELHISCCNVTTLRNISRLSQLETLTIRGVNIRSAEGYSELCLLEKLKNLDMLVTEHDEHSSTICLLAECVEQMAANGARPLRALRELDATGTDITLTAFGTFINHLPRLKLISLVKTPLKREVLQGNRVEILNCATIDSSLNALRFQFYQLEDRHKSIKSILKCITAHHFDEIRRKTANATWRAKTIGLLCEIIGKFYLYDPLELRARCSKILEFICNSQTIEQLTGDEIRQIIKVFIKIMPSSSIESDEFLIFKFWQIFSDPNFLKNFKSMRIDIAIFLRLGLDLCEQRDGSVLIQLVYDVFDTIFKNSDYSDSLLGENLPRNFISRFHFQRIGQANWRVYLKKMKATLAAIENSPIVFDQFLESDGLCILYCAVQKYSDDLPLRTTLLSIQKSVLSRLNNQHLQSLNKPHLSIVANEYFDELKPVAHQMSTHDLDKLYVCVLIAQKIRMSPQITAKVKRIQRRVAEVLNRGNE